MTITTAVTRATLVVATLAAFSTAAEAQRTTRTPTRRQAAIEIRGQVPTPQVVTVRPREVPAYSRQVLVPAFYDHDFWPSITPAYQLVPRRAITGRVPGDTSTMMMMRDSTMRGAAPGGAAPMAPGSLTTPAPAPATPADTVRRTPGTDPARTPR